jgi:hypothetical protein
MFSECFVDTTQIMTAYYLDKHDIIGVSAFISNTYLNNDMIYFWTYEELNSKLSQYLHKYIVF